LYPPDTILLSLTIVAPTDNLLHVDLYDNKWLCAI